MRLEAVNKRYGALVVTHDVSLAVERGEIAGILGPNGAGKTTLFNLVAGTAKPDVGRIFFDDEDITGAAVSERCRKGIARSFQIPHPFGGMTVFENVLVGSTFGGSDHDPLARTADVLRLTQLDRKANALAGTLTLLERKRLEMARALSTDPKLLLLDEIAGGLTDQECQSLLAAIRDIHASGVTIVWIEHVVHALLSVARRLVVMNFGRVIADGEPAAVLANPEVKAVYMGEDVHV